MSKHGSIILKQDHLDVICKIKARLIAVKLHSYPHSLK